MNEAIVAGFVLIVIGIFGLLSGKIGNGLARSHTPEEAPFLFYLSIVVAFGSGVFLIIDGLVQ